VKMSSNGSTRRTRRSTSPARKATSAEPPKLRPLTSSNRVVVAANASAPPLINLDALLGDHVTAQVTGSAHHSPSSPPLTSVQRTVMAASSFMYFLPAATWLNFGFLRLGFIFCVVSILSITADAFSGLLAEPIMVYVRICDRCIGTAALMSAVFFNSTSMLNFLLALVAVLTSLLWFVKGRLVAKVAPTERWRYLSYHCMWHAWGACALVLTTRAAHQRSD
jgi:hypothetical protein